MLFLVKEKITFNLFYFKNLNLQMTIKIKNGHKILNFKSEDKEILSTRFNQKRIKNLEFVLEMKMAKKKKFLLIL